MTRPPAAPPAPWAAPARQPAVLLAELVRDRTGLLLDRLAAHPRRLAEVDRQVRRLPDPELSGALAAAVTELGARHPAPESVALASAHPDGRVRARAVRVILDHPAPRPLLPWLVLRTADWAVPVREAACAALAVLLHRDPAQYLPAAAPAVLAFGARSRSGFARAQLAAAVGAHPGSADLLLASPHPAVRAFAFRAGAARRPLRDLAELAATAPDAAVRGAAAEAAAREAVWTARPEPLRRLADSPHAEVRATVLAGLVRLGDLRAVADRLDDPAPLVRPPAPAAGGGRARAPRPATTARPPAGGGAAGRGWWGPPPPGRGGPPAPVGGGPIAAIAETGRAADAALLHPVLAHPSAVVRVRAVRGLRQLGAVPVDLLLPLLHDPSAKVVRETATALRTVPETLPPGLGAGLLARGARPAERRAGLRLLAGADPLTRLDLLLGALRDPDPGVGRLVRAHAVALVRRLGPADLRAAPAGSGAALAARAEAVGELLGEREVQRLYELLVPDGVRTELRRARDGRLHGLVLPGRTVELVFTAEDADAVAGRLREAFCAALDGPDAPLPDWFRAACGAAGRDAGAWHRAVAAGPGRGWAWGEAHGWGRQGVLRLAVPAVPFAGEELVRLLLDAAGARQVAVG
ncbi:hypothetical protein [Kitasatospora sp. NPDC059571]|uniref:hypothetical protein n=1 Tax=Kitasatospora sp. NPDC059571 TaxID=3346871 RepID=UPI0036C8E1B5